MQVVGNFVTLPGGGSFKVSLKLQASPCGTAVTLMGGYWQVRALGLPLLVKSLA